VRSATAFLEQYKHPIVFGNLAIARTMRGEYAQALDNIDQAVAAYRPGLSALIHDVAPDIAAATHHRVLYAEGIDLIVALRYFRAFIFALEGDTRFETALREADAANGSDARSLDSFLFALDFIWLAGRGQAVNLPKVGGQQDGPANYGIFAAQGALWERAAAVQPHYYFAARNAYEIFQRNLCQGGPTRATFRWPVSCRHASTLPTSRRRNRR